MPLIYMKTITREMVQKNPDFLFVFGDNVMRQGLKGQAAAMRGEPNARGIATKWYPSLNEDAFFNDRDYHQIQDILHADLVPIAQAIHAGRTVIWPEDGIGTGLSQLPTRAPQVWQFLEGCRQALTIISQNHAESAIAAE